MVQLQDDLGQENRCLLSSVQRKNLELQQTYTDPLTGVGTPRLEETLQSMQKVCEITSGMQLCSRMWRPP
jgi:hypothetical protein